MKPPDFWTTSAAVLVFITTYITRTSATIQCYKCTTTKPPMHSNETVRLCEDFDYSDRYIVDCPYSTFCMKRWYTAKIPVPINATERDCASQKYMTQNFKDGRWQPEVYIEEPYTEGCSVPDDKGFRTSTTIQCYCKSYLCNSSTGLHKNNNLFYSKVLSLLFLMLPAMTVMITNRY